MTNLKQNRFKCLTILNYDKVLKVWSLKKLVPRRCGSETLKFGIKWVDVGPITVVKDNKAHIFSVDPSSERKLFDLLNSIDAKFSCMTELRMFVLTPIH